MMDQQQSQKQQHALPHESSGSGVRSKRSSTDSNLDSELNAKRHGSSPNSLSVNGSSSLNSSLSGASLSRIIKDEPVPEGYSRYRFNEDCGHVTCGYREHQTHFHCERTACGYSFCDKTRFVQHSARHDRLDKLMGPDFQSYRSNIDCGFDDCPFKPSAHSSSLSPSLGGASSSSNQGSSSNNKQSHFHCLKCDFVCSDTNKVTGHRKHHYKMDSINAAGFEKYTPSQDCSLLSLEGLPAPGALGENGECIYNRKQTHYHCLKCNYSVLGLSQMSSHKYKHLNDNGNESNGN